jgi:hypothetical protein
MTSSSRTGARAGTILIIVAGLSALLASLALTFLVRNRSDAEEAQSVLRDVQARIMLVAALNYIQEGSRIGWDRYPNTPRTRNDAFPGGDMSATEVAVHEETFGWLDVRDGRIGPITQEGHVVWSSDLRVHDGIRLRPAWPAPDSIVRCPMHVWKRTRFATTMHAAYNPIQTHTPTATDYLMPYLRNRDPMPAGIGWLDHAQGDDTPTTDSAGRAWFRILREGPSTFLITCGAGGTLGFRSYAEVVAQGQQDLFNNDPGFFSILATQESRLWYRAEWSASSAEPTYHWQQHHTTFAGNSNVDSYLQWPLNASHSWNTGPRSPAFDKNQGGTFRWIMRLKQEPTNW